MSNQLKIGHQVWLFIEEIEHKNTTHSIDGVDLCKNLQLVSSRSGFTFK
jgi:hypothetical protein